jgi:hypothetical protein
MECIVTRISYIILYYKTNVFLKTTVCNNVYVLDFIVH